MQKPNLHQAACLFQKNTDAKVAKTNVQVPATIAGQNLTFDQPTLAPAQKMAKKDAIKLPLIQKEQIKL